MRPRSAPRKFDTEQQLYTAALRALMRRAHSIHEMKQYLDLHAAAKELIPPVIARLRESQYLDDARYALEYARQHAQSRRQGRFRIARELRARGVPSRHIEAALDSIFAETDEAGLVRARLKRHISMARGGIEQLRDRSPAAQRKIASLYRSLLRAGFSRDAIRTELRALTQVEFSEPPDSPDEHE